MTTPRPRILAVDDEQAVLDGLELNLRRRFDLQCCLSGQLALDVLDRDRSFAVVISDMRMPGMSGAAFLAKAREIAPDATRLLLTGQSDLDSAIAAINDGQIYRFLTKPCPPPVLIGVVESAVELHRLVTSERTLLEKTLKGAVQVLGDVLALTSPDFFGRANRIKALACAVSDLLGLSERWQLEVAALFSQLGYVSLPAETMAKVFEGKGLAADEQKMLERVPRVVEQMLEPIPRLERVHEMLVLANKAWRGRPKDASPEVILLHEQAHVLRLAIDLDVLESTGLSTELALATVRGRGVQYDADIVEACAKALGALERSHNTVQELSPSALRVGMVLLSELRTSTGVLIVPKGYEVTMNFLARVRNYPQGTLPAIIRVLVRGVRSQ